MTGEKKEKDRGRRRRNKGRGEGSKGKRREEGERRGGETRERFPPLEWRSGYAPDDNQLSALAIESH